MAHALPALASAFSPYWNGLHPSQLEASPATARDQSVVYDVAIVGGGWIGLFAAYTLAQKKKRVAIFDQGTFGCEASGNNAGFLLDQCEDVLALIKRFDKALAKRILRYSLNRINTIQNIAALEGFDAGFNPTGHIVGFDTRNQKNRFYEASAWLTQNLSDIYPAGYLTTLSPKQTGAKDYYDRGAAYSRYGGTYIPAWVVAGMKKALQNNDYVDIFEKTKVVEIKENKETQHIKMYVENVDGAFVQAKKALFAGGRTYELPAGKCEDFPYPALVMEAAMEVTGIRADIIKQLAPVTGPETPIIEFGSANPYHFFDVSGMSRKMDKGSFIFGSSARAREYDRMESDLLYDLDLVQPRIAKLVNRENCSAWGKLVAFSDSDVPGVLLFNFDGKKLVRAPIEDGVSGAQVIFAGFLAGQGGNFGPGIGVDAGLAIAGDRRNEIDIFYETVPTESLSSRAAEKRLARDRNIYKYD